MGGDIKLEHRLTITDAGIKPKMRELATMPAVDSEGRIAELPQSKNKAPRPEDNSADTNFEFKENFSLELAGKVIGTQSRNESNAFHSPGRGLHLQRVNKTFGSRLQNFPAYIVTMNLQEDGDLKIHAASLTAEISSASMAYDERGKLLSAYLKLKDGTSREIELRNGREPSTGMNAKLTIEPRRILENPLAEIEKLLPVTELLTSCANNYLQKYVRDNPDIKNLMQADAENQQREIKFVQDLEVGDVTAYGNNLAGYLATIYHRQAGASVIRREDSGNFHIIDIESQKKSYEIMLQESGNLQAGGSIISGNLIFRIKNRDPIKEVTYSYSEGKWCSENASGGGRVYINSKEGLDLIKEQVLGLAPYVYR